MEWKHIVYRRILLDKGEEEGFALFVLICFSCYNIIAIELFSVLIWNEIGFANMFAVSVQKNFVTK